MVLLLHIQQRRTSFILTFVKNCGKTLQDQFANEIFLAIMPQPVSSGPLTEQFALNCCSFKVFVWVRLSYFFTYTLGFFLCYVDILTEHV